MALIKCPECGREVSDKSQTCVGCGYPISEIVSSIYKTKNCPECGKEIPIDAKPCPECGYAFEELNKKNDKKISNKGHKKTALLFLIIPVCSLLIICFVGLLVVLLLVLFGKEYSSQEIMYDSIKGTYLAKTKVGNTEKIFVGPEKIWFKNNTYNEEHEISNWDIKKGVIETSDGLLFSFDDNELNYNNEKYEKIDPKDEMYINEQLFPDEQFRNCVSYWADADKDGILNWVEIEQREQFDQLDYKKIKSLEGIDLFYNLKYVKCDHNNISNLDVSSLQKLEYLDCSYNAILSLDVSSLQKIETLDCSYNEMKSLCVTNCLSLCSLSCDNNDIDSIDISNCPGLLYAIVKGENNKYGEVIICHTDDYSCWLSADSDIKMKLLE